MTTTPSPDSRSSPSTRPAVPAGAAPLAPPEGLWPVAFDNTYARELPGFYAPVRAAPAPAPRLLYLNHALAHELGLDAAALDSADGAELFAGNRVPPGAEPLAQAYAGHQFGGFSPQLGDGRALLWGEVLDTAGRRRDIALKGSGRTPFSRSGDGKAAVGPMLREVVMGEALHALGIPTTRALAVCATGEPVLRDRVLRGAVLTRVAASHLRVGTFQYFAARGETDRVRQLLHYALRRHDPALADDSSPALALLRAVAQRQARLIAQWLQVGFIHGVMNTDNMTISGETIDFGPCAFLEAYDPQAVFSSIDHHGRYAFGNQAAIAQWNLARLAETLLPLIGEDAESAVPPAMEILQAFPAWLDGHLQWGLQRKLGLAPTEAAPVTSPGALPQASAGAPVPGPVTVPEPDQALARDWLDLLHRQRLDHTLAWRRLGQAARGQPEPLRDLAPDREALDAWLARWQSRCAQQDAARAGAAAAPVETRATLAHPPTPAQIGRASAMDAVNPWLIPRNHRVEEVLQAAAEGDDLQPLQQLLAALQRPFDDQPAAARWAEPAPEELTARYQTFCGT